MDLLSNFTIIGHILWVFLGVAMLAGGGMWLLWGAILLATGLKDKSGPQLQQGIWQIVGGLMIIIATLLFRHLTSAPVLLVNQASMM